MIEKINRFINKTQFILNKIIILYWIFFVIFRISIGAGIFIFFGILLGFPGMTIINYLLIIIAGGIIGSIIGIIKKLDRENTARWLDRHLNINDIFSASLYCIKNKPKGLFDDLIIKKANIISEKNIKIKLPLKIIFQYFFKACIVCVFFVLIFLFFKPNFNITAIVKKIINENIKQESFQKQKEKKDQSDEKKSSKALSKMLFPDNPKKSEIAEKAIDSGNTEMLKELMKQENILIKERIKKNKNPAEKKLLNKEMQKKKDLVKQIIKKNNKSNSKNKKVNNKKNDEGDSDNSQNNDGNSENNEDSGAQENDKKNRQVSDSSQDEEEGEDDLIDDLNAGKENNGNNTDWGNIEGNNNQEKLIIENKNNNNEYELLLKDKNSFLPLIDIIPDSKQSVESYIKRKEIPIEYEDFVRSYFKILNEEINNYSYNEGENNGE